VQLQQGNNRLNINTGFLQAGVYHVIIQLDGKGGGISRKIVKQ
jgi:hypothetical protein